MMKYSPTNLIDICTYWDCGQQIRCRNTRNVQWCMQPSCRDVGPTAANPHATKATLLNSSFWQASYIARVFVGLKPF